MPESTAPRRRGSVRSEKLLDPIRAPQRRQEHLRQQRRQFLVPELLEDACERGPVTKPVSFRDVPLQLDLPQRTAVRRGPRRARGSGHRPPP
jgi:hypothetical protein